jgi:hypothetical protein
MPFHSRTARSQPAVAIIVAGVVLLSATVAGSPPGKPGAGPATPRKQVAAAIDDAVGTLGDPDYRQFIEYYAPVQFLQMVRRQPGGVNAFADRISRDKRAAGQFKVLVKRLRKARKAQPVFNDEKTIARFDFILEPARKLKPEDLPFGKIAKKKVPLKGYGANLAAAMDKARAALEKGDLAGYLSRMLPESDLQVDDVATLAKRLKSSPAAVKQIIADLKLLKTQTPKLEQKGTVAVFRIHRKEAAEPGRKRGVKLPDRVFKFQKAGGNWRLYDNTKGLRAAASKFGEIPAVRETLVMEKFRDHWRISAANEDEMQTWQKLFYRLRSRKARLKIR